MTRKKPISETPASVRALRPHLAPSRPFHRALWPDGAFRAASPDANRSNNRIDELDAQRAWQHHIDAGRIEVGETAPRA